VYGGADTFSSPDFPVGRLALTASSPEMLIAIGQRFTDHPESVATAEKLTI